jgi:hypothetical protein
MFYLTTYFKIEILHELEELEELAEQFVDDNAALGDDKEEDDPTQKPALASNLQSTEI